VEPLPPATRQECLAAADFVEPSGSPYCLPYTTGSSHSVSQSYCSPAPGSHETRFAYDFAMPLGTEIRAARAGVVVELREHWLDTDRTSGHENMISLRHEDDTISLYLHLQHEGVVPEMGDTIPMGGLLGYSGNTGDSSGFPHLHFQVCLRGGMCSWKTGEYTLPVSFRNALGPLDSRGGLSLGATYEAGSCSG
jgi:murein DD-endopeptidase MepM/ murein hydrolase activator NlpD